MKSHSTVTAVAALAAIVGVAAAAIPVAAQVDLNKASKLRNPAALTEQAPAKYTVNLDTSKGPVVIEVHRDWAPLGADRFYNLVKNGFYDGTRFFRVLEGFMAQFGLNGDPDIQAAWRTANLADEPVTQSNRRGFVSFTRESGPNSRFTMIFINYKDNSYLDADGFAPFGEVVSGMDVADKLYSGYGRTNIPDQRRIVREGNAYLSEEYPKLDYVRRAAIAPARPARGSRE